MAEKPPRSGRAVLAAGLVISTAAIAAVSGGDTKHERRDSQATTPAKSADVMLRSKAERVTRTGGVLIGYEIGKGVDCDSRSKIKIWQGPNKGKYFLQSSNNFDSDPNMNELVQDNYESGATRTIFVGRDSDPILNLGGYYALESGWAVRHTTNTINYDLYHFDGIKSDGTTPITTEFDKKGQPVIDDLPLGSIIGQKLVSFTMGDLTVGRTFSWQDGQSSVTVQSAAINSFPPRVEVDVACDPALPVVTEAR